MKGPISLAVLMVAILIAGGLTLGYLGPVLSPLPTPTGTIPPPYRALGGIEEGYVYPGRPWEPEVSAESSECDETPEFLNHFGIPLSKVHPDFPTSGDMQDILEWSGMKVDRSLGCEKALPGQTYVKLTAIEGRCGVAAIIPHIEQNDRPLSDVLFWFSWPDAATCPSEADPRYKSTCVGGFTDGGGSVGFGVGPYAFISPGKGGPYSTWPNGCKSGSCIYGTWVGADALIGTGWFGGTDHCLFNPWYEPVVKEGSIPPVTPTPPVPVSGYMLVDTDESGVDSGYIPFQTGQPPASRVLKLRLDGQDLGFVPWE